jgi:hypothetical protein
LLLVHPAKTLATPGEGRKFGAGLLTLYHWTAADAERTSA